MSERTDIQVRRLPEKAKCVRGGRGRDRFSFDPSPSSASDDDNEL